MSDFPNGIYVYRDSSGTLYKVLRLDGFWFFPGVDCAVVLDEEKIECLPSD